MHIVAPHSSHELYKREYPDELFPAAWYRCKYVFMPRHVGESVEQFGAQGSATSLRTIATARGNGENVNVRFFQLHRIDVNVVARLGVLGRVLTSSTPLGTLGVG